MRTSTSFIMRGGVPRPLIFSEAFLTLLSESISACADAFSKTPCRTGPSSPYSPRYREPVGTRHMVDLVRLKNSLGLGISYFLATLGSRPGHCCTLRARRLGRGAESAIRRYRIASYATRIH